MSRSKTFNIINAVRFDMHIHGGRFIIWEFIIASIILAGVVVVSVIHFFSTTPSFFGGLWVFSFLGVLLNCLIIAILAARIGKKEGNRPKIVGKINPKLLSLMFTAYIIIPYLLSFVTCRQIEKD